jgi:hypothetical protein
MPRNHLVSIAYLAACFLYSPDILHAQNTAIDFEHQIVPILRTHCATCHAGREHEGDFSINTRAKLLESGAVNVEDPAASRLLELITSKDTDDQMPPSDRPRLEQPEIDLLRRWIQAELPWPLEFSFDVKTYEPPVRPRPVELPPAVQGRNHPIDRILDNYQVQHGKSLPTIVEDEAFIRRATLDLIGLLPTPEELTKFQQDTSTEKRAALVERLLDRKIDYADHWLTFFNDLLRNDYSGTGFITGGRKQISQWLYESLLSNKPFDLMTRELVSPPTMASRGYIDGIQWRGTVSAGQTLEMQFSQSISQSFLGINMKCASCHDSFIDRWTLKEAYGLAAIYATAPLSIHRCDKPTGQQQVATWLFPELGQIDPSAPRDQRLKQLSLLMTDPQNGRFARTIVNRLWHRLMGRGIVHPLDAMQSEPWNEDLLDYLANVLVEHNYDLKAIMRLIATSQAYQSSTQIAAESTSLTDYVYNGPIARRMTAEQFLDAVWQLTGAAPTAIAAPVFRYDLSQVDLAAIEVTGQWVWGELVDNQAPADESLLIRRELTLPAEVVSGGAIVTCDNEFQMYVGGREIASGTEWTELHTVALRNVLKKGANSLVFRVKNGGAAGSQGPAGLFFEAHMQLADGSHMKLVTDNQWEYHRQPPAPREGRLNAPAEGWVPVHIASPQSVWSAMLEREARSKLAVLQLPNEQMPMVRASLVKNTPLMQSLGRPLREQIVSMRPDGLTTLEAIDLANEPTLAAAFERGGQSWLKREWPSTETLVESLFVEALTRVPTDAERQQFLQFLGEKPTPEAISDSLWAICMLPEFMLVR